MLCRTLPSPADRGDGKAWEIASYMPTGWACLALLLFLGEGKKDKANRNGAKQSARGECGQNAT